MIPPKEITMRYSKLVLMSLGLAAMLVAADPFVGTWKLDPALSKFKTGAPPKEQTVTITEEGGDLHVVIRGTAAGGQPISAEYTVPEKGGAGKLISGPWEGLTEKRTNETQRDLSYTKGGKVVYTVHLKVSPDGKSMTAAVKGTDPAGQKVDGTDVTKRQ